MVGTGVSLSRRVVGAFAAIVGATVVGHSTVGLIDAMAAADAAAYAAIAGVAIGALTAIVGTMIVFGSLWAQTAATVVFPAAAIFSALRFGATGSTLWAVTAGANVVFFVLLLGRKPPRAVDVDDETSGIWVGTIH